MNDEAAFLARIRATPDDLAPRLVYADWLEDNDDPRGELIRVVEEMRTLAPYSDAYWALKPRRKALRDGVADEWLEAMRYNDVWPIFTHGWPDGWRERWRLIRELVERWHGIAMPDVGRFASGVAELEQQVGQFLPPSVRERFAFVSDMRRHPDRHLYIGNDASNAYAANENVVVLYSLGTMTGGIQCVVRCNDFGAEDPPVYVIHGKQSERPLETSVSEYALRHSVMILRPSGTIPQHDLSNEELLRDLHASCHINRAIGHVHYFEQRNMRIVIHLQNQRPMHFSLHVAKPVALAEIPASLHQSTQVVYWRERGMIL